MPLGKPEIMIDYLSVHIKILGKEAVAPGAFFRSGQYSLYLVLPQF
jgi:hypothetical protein